MKSFLTKLVALVTLALMTTAGFADDKTRPTDPPTASAATKQLSVDDLRGILEAMGYTPTAVKSKDGKTVGYTIKVEYGTWKVYTDICLSKDGSNLWFTVDLRKLEGMPTIPTEVVVKLLAKNGSIWPAYFCSYANGFLYLAMPLPNQNVTAAVLRSKINTLASIVMDTSKLWDPKAWPTATVSAPSPKP